MRNREILRAILAPHAPNFDGDSIEELTLEAVARKTLAKYNGPVPYHDAERDARDFKSLLVHLERFVARLADFRAYAAAHEADWTEARDELRAEWNQRLFAAAERREARHG